MSQDQEPIEVGNELNLTFYAAYQQHGEVKKYLGDGAGHVRLFKDPELLRNYLEQYLSPEDMARTVIHPVQGLIAVPEPDKDGGALVPITTLWPPTVPTAGELLHEIKTGRKRHKPKGAR
jgi:hypothetical protein